MNARPEALDESMLESPIVWIILVSGVVLLGIGHLSSRRSWRREEWEADVVLVDEYEDEMPRYGQEYTQCHIEYRRDDGKEGVYRFIVDREPELQALRRVRPGDRLVKRRGEDVPRPTHSSSGDR